MSALKALSEAAERAAAPVNAALATNTTDTLSIETLEACDRAVDAFNIALRGAYRSGKLVEAEPLLALLAEAREALRQFAEGEIAEIEERLSHHGDDMIDSGAARISEIRATLSHIDATLAADPEARA